jgi:LPS-assembly protein
VKRCSQIPHDVCGVARTQSLVRRFCEPAARVSGGFFAASARAVLFAALAIGLLADVASAQDPSVRNQVGSDRFFKPVPGGPLGPQPKINNAAPLYLQGDDLTYDTKGNKVTARGNVQIYYNNFLLTADQVTYDQGTNRLIAEGNVQLRDPNGNITRAERIEATDDLRDAFVQSLSVVSRDETRIQARRSIRRDGNVTEFEDGKFTPCKNDPGKPPLWCISASRIIHDQKAATLTYQDAKFEFFGTTVLALPYFQMPDPSVRHRTGFLSPTFGSSTSLGTFFELPYYIALDKSFDFLFNPALLSKQGVLYKGEWRQRLENGQVRRPQSATEKPRCRRDAGS